LSIDLLPGNRVLRGQGAVAHQVQLGVLQHRLVLGQLALRLGERDLIGAGSICARTSPLLTIWPSRNATSTSWPLICVLTVTMASGVTVPSPFKVTGMSPFSALAVPTGIGPPDWRRPLGAGWCAGRQASQALRAATSRRRSRS